jgi:DNA-binding NtrC family response regulator
MPDCQNWLRRDKSDNWPYTAGEFGPQKNMQPLRILVIDDDELVRAPFGDWLKQEGYDVRLAENGAEALAALESGIFDVAFLDIHMPDMSGIEVLEAMKRRDPEIDAVIVTGYPKMESVIQALRLGAYDFLTKPLDWVSLGLLLQRIVERRYLRNEVTTLRNRLAETPNIGEMVGVSRAMQQLRDLIAKVAPSDSAILIEGESGTGKELVAYAIHRLSGRTKGPFVPVNCAAIPAELMESEIFGHLKGAFSSATSDARGLFRSADGGTLFLDEIGDLPQQMQPKLLRVLQEKEVRPVGSTQTHRVDVRVVAATNQNLEKLVQEGKFRQDLFFRLNVVRIETLPLRTVKEDILPLAMSLVRKLNRRFKRRVQSIAPDAISALAAYDFPGNVRELENIIERAYALGADNQITLQDLPSLSKLVAAPAVPAPSKNSPRSLDDLERELIAQTLQIHDDDKAKVAEALGMSERTLYRRLKKHGLG